ncbi:glycosyltransferase family 87 protein [Qipengyuania qiaonensis]|uniref:DUF2029 domain-containing protein n=1 Tax=Qipengyuania qiaonensis TaxID=2867240 RepID=A0ABS7J1U1_9SPHN|nr:glycosyltransferase family 87 protein [Qipengyuania qiaonensis]MBX7481296.1 DUF2029 domain-containing protein [Qipengyuania qiaonensis]
MGSFFHILRSADWLTADRVTAVLRLLALLQAGLAIWLVVNSSGGVDSNGQLLGTDFVSFWTSGKMVLDGLDPYDISAHIAAQREVYIAQNSYVGFFYPPSILPFFVPFGFTDYIPALIVWLAITGGLYLLAVRAWALSLWGRPPGAVLVLASPALWLCVAHGQTSFLVAFLLGAGVLLVDRRPWLAGILFGLATIKPQMGLLVPVVLLASGQWRVIVGAGLASAGLALLASGIAGLDTWNAWLATGDVARAALTEGQIGFAKLQSTFSALRLMGVPDAIAIAVQIACSLGVASVLAFAGWRNGWSVGLGATMLAGTMVATPFVLDYDFVLLAFPLMFLATDGFRPWERFLTAALFVAPLFARTTGLYLGVPLLAPLTLALFAVMATRLFAESKRNEAMTA